jgi:hypothetical protein
VDDRSLPFEVRTDVGECFVEFGGMGGGEGYIIDIASDGKWAVLGGEGCDGEVHSVEDNNLADCTACSTPNSEAIGCPNGPVNEH